MRSTEEMWPDPDRPVEAALMAFFARAVGEFLELHLGGGRVARRGNRLTVSFAGASRFQLRFLPDACSWSLFERVGRAWKVCPGPQVAPGLEARLKQLRKRLAAP